MAVTYEPIASTTLGTANNSITFSSIPSTYTDLKLVFLGTSPTAANPVQFQFNGDTAANYSYTYLLGNGTGTGAATTASTSNIAAVLSSGVSTYPALIIMDIMGYASSVHKTSLIKSGNDLNASGGQVEISVAAWRSTSAINSIKVYLPSTYQMGVGTRVTIYGIKAA